MFRSKAYFFYPIQHLSSFYLYQSKLPPIHLSEHHLLLFDLVMKIAENYVIIIGLLPLCRQNKILTGRQLYQPYRVWEIACFVYKKGIWLEVSFHCRQMQQMFCNLIYFFVELITSLLKLYLNRCCMWIRTHTFNANVTESTLILRL